MDRVVVLASWVETLLKVNGVESSKIVRSAHGIDARPVVSRPGRESSQRLRLIHVGRADPTKGTEILIRAMLAAPEAPIELDVFGVVQDQAGADLLQSLRALTAADARIRFLPRLAHDELCRRLADYDLAVVPSQWMETGPLIVLEAFAAGIPVLGSALGGIAEKVTPEVDGLLVHPYDSVDAWRTTLRRCATDRALISQLRRAVQTPRSADEVAGDMAALYAELTA